MDFFFTATLFFTPDGGDAIQVQMLSKGPFSVRSFTTLISTDHFLIFCKVLPSLVLKLITILFARFAAITHPGRAQEAPLGRSHYASSVTDFTPVELFSTNVLLQVILFLAQLPFWAHTHTPTHITHLDPLPAQKSVHQSTF